MDGKVYLTPELVALFKSNWDALVTTNHDCRISYPFFYMKSEGFWELKPQAGFSHIDKMGSLVKSFTNLHAAVEYAQLDKDLVKLLNDAPSANVLLQFLLDEYFPETKSNLSGGGTSGLMDDYQDKFFNEPAEEYRSKAQELLEQHEDEEIFLRGSVFKREIPRVYNSSCCISGMKVDSTYNISMIDACHIVPFSESYDDTVTNGIALCPNLHRAFDRGMISISPDYKVMVSDQFLEEGDYPIRQYQGRRISLPANSKYWPKRENLEWHNHKVLKE